MELLKYSTLISLLLLLAISLTQAITQCTIDEDACGCKTDQGTISLKKYADQPFSATDTLTSYTYYWSPCKDITKGTIVSVTASCIQEVNTDQYYDCGTHNSAKTSVDDKGNAAFSLDAGDGQRHSVVTCICKENAVDVFTFDGEDPVTAGIYDMSLTGESCCPKAGPGPSPSGGGGGSGGLSGGSILLIIVLVVVVVYLVGGVIVQSTVRKAEGRERIPNVALWSAIPGLIKDGFRFTFSCGKSTHYGEI